MSREFPDWLNPWKAAEGKRIFSGTVPLDRMSRLKPLLAGATSEAAFTAVFALDGQKRATIELEVTAELPLICQSSLDKYLHPVRRKSLLAVIQTEAEQDQLPDHYEATCPDGGRLVFADLVEDELLLAMPQVPHKPGLGEVRFSTRSRGWSEPGERKDRTHQPFAALKELMRGGQRDQDTETD